MKTVEPKEPKLTPEEQRLKEAKELLQKEFLASQKKAQEIINKAMNEIKTTGFELVVKLHLNGDRVIPELVINPIK